MKLEPISSANSNKSEIFYFLFLLSSNFLCSIDRTLHLQELNPAWEKFLGWTPEELRSKPLTHWIHAEDVETTSLHLKKLFADSGENAKFENRWRHKNGKWVLLHWIATYQHSTLLASVEKNCEQLPQHLMSTLHHEMRTPLTSIRGALGLVAEGITGKLPEQAEKYIKIALSNSDSLWRLIEDKLPKA